MEFQVSKTVWVQSDIVVSMVILLHTQKVFRRNNGLIAACRDTVSTDLIFNMRTEVAVKVEISLLGNNLKDYMFLLSFLDHFLFSKEGVYLTKVSLITI